jgi:hypothetical protein
MRRKDRNDLSEATEIPTGSWIIESGNIGGVALSVAVLTVSAEGVLTLVGSRPPGLPVGEECHCTVDADGLRWTFRGTPQPGAEAAGRTRSFGASGTAAADTGSFTLQGLPPISVQPARSIWAR